MDVMRNRFSIAQLDGTADHFVTDVFFSAKHLRKRQHNGGDHAASFANWATALNGQALICNLFMTHCF